MQLLEQIQNYIPINPQEENDKKILLQWLQSPYDI